MNEEFSNIFTKSKLKSKPLILDGAMGSLLQQKGFRSKGSAWMTYVNSESPETIISIHKNYIEAGADIITTNTFGTNTSSAGNITVSEKEVKKAVFLAKSAVENSHIYIAGSNAPAEDCYQKQRNLSYNELQKNHTYHIDLLIDNGVDFILNETQSHFDEIRIICEHCSINNIPFVVSLYCDENLELLSGEKVEEVIKFVREHNPLAIGINCISPNIFSKLTENLNLENINIGFYLNCIEGSDRTSGMICSVSPRDYGETIKDYLKLNPAFIGACCGSSPDHIREIRKLIDG